MVTLNSKCSGLRDRLLSYIGDQTDVMEVDGLCVVTLPIKTVDDRWIDVYVEPTATDYFLVHDAGKTTSELKLHGVNMTEAKHATLFDIASRFDAMIRDGSFAIGCKPDGVQRAIFSIGQCASLGMIELLKHTPNYQETPIMTQIGDTLDAWSVSKATIQRHVHINGKTAPHEFDFVAHPLGNMSARTVALRVLHPAYAPMSSARNFGFLSLDLPQEYSKWKRLAVIARSEAWTQDAIALVAKHASRVLKVDSNRTEEIRDHLPEIMDQLQRAA